MHLQSINKKKLPAFLFPQVVLSWKEKWTCSPRTHPFSQEILIPQSVLFNVHNFLYACITVTQGSVMSKENVSGKSVFTESTCVYKITTIIIYTLNNTCFLFFYNRNNCWVLEHTTSLTLLITCPESLAANEECVKQEKQDLIPQNWLVNFNFQRAGFKPLH